jgi:hypothetical protein
VDCVDESVVAALPQPARAKMATSNRAITEFVPLNNLFTLNSSIQIIFIY